MHGKISDTRKTYYVRWVEKFLMYLENESGHINLNMKSVHHFLSSVCENTKYTDWQVYQSFDAIYLFVCMLIENESDLEK